MAAASTVPRPAARRVAGGALDDLRRPGASELAAVAFAAVVLAGVAIAGGTRATGGPSTSGMAIGVDRVAAGPAGTTVLEVLVANGSGRAFSGRLTAGAPGGDRRAAVELPAGASRSIELSVPAPCGSPVSLVLEGLGGAIRRASATAPCDGTGGG